MESHVFVLNQEQQVFYKYAVTSFTEELNSLGISFFLLSVYLPMEEL